MVVIYVLLSNQRGAQDGCKCDWIEVIEILPTSNTPSHVEPGDPWVRRKITFLEDPQDYPTFVQLH